MKDEMNFNEMMSLGVYELKDDGNGGAYFDIDLGQLNNEQRQMLEKMFSDATEVIFE